MEIPSLEPSVATETLDQRRAAMLERLSNRHQSRNNNNSNTDSSPTIESTQSFLTQFSESKLSIESHLSDIRQNPDPSRKPELESLSLEISSLEKLVAEKSYFLPPYEVRSSLSTVALLKRSFDEVSSLVIPRKKFSFKNKTKPITSIVAQNDVIVRETEKRINVVGFGFRDRENALLVKEFDRSEFGEFTLSGLKGCEVRLKGCVRALFMDRLVDCKIYVGAVMGSVLIEGAEGCVFVLASHQIRIHNAKECDFYLRVRSRPIIEDSKGVRFAPYCLSYEGSERDLDEANLGEETGNWANVDDFRWLRAVQSPNWSILPENDRVDMVNISKAG